MDEPGKCGGTPCGRPGVPEVVELKSAVHGTVPSCALIAGGEKGILDTPTATCGNVGVAKSAGELDVSGATLPRATDDPAKAALMAGLAWGTPV